MLFIDENPKHEILNPKQYQMFKIQMIKTKAAICLEALFWNLNI